MIKPCLQFLLVPDSSAARRLRRRLAEAGSRQGVVVGTLSELVELARQSYLVPEPLDGWDVAITEALEAIPDAFWTASYSVAPIETRAAIEVAFLNLVAATDPELPLSLQATGPVPPRAARHLHDLVRLNDALEGALPAEYMSISAVIGTPPKDALRHIHVAYVAGLPTLTRWQAELVEKLNADAAAAPPVDLVACLWDVLSDVDEPISTTSLATLQARLFSPPDDKVALDQTVQWLGVRDFLAEAEVAAGMVQTMLAGDDELSPADIGLLLPESFEYAVAVEDAFTLAGLALSGLPVERWRRDLGREALFHFLYCRQKPAPAMALAVCLSSPLMPWSREEGAVLAQRVMDGDYGLKPLPNFGQEARAMLDLIRGGDTTPDSLGQAVQAFVELLVEPQESTEYLRQTRQGAQDLATFLAQATEIDWQALRRHVTPRYITTGESPDFTREGITVWREGHEPWREVRQLIVLGFAEGHYPTVPGNSPVFSIEEWSAINRAYGLTLPTPDEAMQERRRRFKRQLGAVAEGVSFLVPRRDPTGAAQAPSESVVFMQTLFDIPDEDGLILELDAAADRALARHLAQADEGTPIPPRLLAAQDLDFGRDLLALRKDREGQIKPESPSSLETLMVSRLAWLLRRLNAEPLGWAPEKADVSLLGTLAHDVFEHLFQPGESVPTDTDISERVPTLLDDAIRERGPFLRASEWQVERSHLATGIIKAAIAWRGILDALDAEVVGSEVWLAGHLDGVSIHGQADVLVQLPNDRLLVVDYKRSSSNSRRPRMKAGYDSQAHLYRTMLRTGGPKDTDNTGLRHRLTAAKQTGIVYYMLNDQTALSDSRLVGTEAIPLWEALDEDVADKAMALIGQRLQEVQRGFIQLNRACEAAFFEKTAGIKPYALENSPLIALFSLPDDEEVAE